MPLRVLSLACLLLAASPSVAQTFFVLPAGFDVRAGNRFDEYLAAYDGAPQQPAHLQQLYNVSDVPMPAAVLRGMNLRRAGGANNQAGVLTLTIDLSLGPRDAFAVSETFADNLGAMVQRVFSGNLNLPSESGGPQPSPWSVTVPFSPPFPFVTASGSALVLDIHVSNFNPGQSQESWYFDAAGTSRGSRANNGPTPGSTGCRFNTGTANTSLSSMPPAVGGVWWLQYGGVPPGLPGFGVLGSQGVGGNWANVPLPIDLGPSGAPGCRWHVDVLFIQPLLPDSGGRFSAWPRVPIPNDPSLVSAVFFDHSLWLDRAANALGIVTGWSSRWTMGNALAPNASLLVNLEDSTPPARTGRVDRGYGLIVRFQL